MAKGQKTDQNLRNVVKDLEEDITQLGSHARQQKQQQTNDRRHQDALNHDEYWEE